MRNAVRSWVLSLLPATFWLVCGLNAQEVCLPPPVVTSTPGSNIFTDQQEFDLGEILAQQLLRHIRSTDDAAVTAHLAQIGERLAKHLPANQIQFRYFLVDLPVPEAFSEAGGRIYVSREMVSSVHNEDEMASIIAHEMGHIVTHQTALEMTALLRGVLNVTAVSDREDILKKCNALEENWRRNPGPFREVAKRGPESERAADQMGLYLMAAAGYAPQSFADVFDRTARTGGKTGSWLSDFLGATKPDQLRLRALRKSVEKMPQVCVDRQPLLVDDDFEKWRAAVNALPAWKRKGENLHGVLARVKLEPVLHPKIVESLQFSPDGKYLLAEHAGTFYILSREPFAYLFQIHAPDASQPRFTADSKFIAFTTDILHIELWDIAGRKRAQVAQPSIKQGCFTTLLAPDARTLACLRQDDVISLIDLPSGAEIFEKTGFARYSTFFGRYPTGPKLGFSPDGRYFLAARRENAVFFDVQSRQELSLPADLRRWLSDGFVFLGSDRLLVLSGFNNVPGRAALLIPTGKYETQYIPTDTHYSEMRPATLFAFPSWKVIDHLTLGFKTVSAPAHGNYLVIRPIKDYPVGVMDLRTKKLFLADKRQALDIYDEVFVDQRPDGDLALHDAKSGRLLAHAPLPIPPSSQGLGRPYTSPDLKWLVDSAGPIWDLSTGKRLQLLRPFQGGWFDGENAFFADFPKHGDTPHTIARVDLTRKEVIPVLRIEDLYARQSGPFLVVSKPQQKTRLAAVVSPCNWKFPDYSPLDCDVIDEVRDAATGRVLWSRRFPKDHPGLLVEPEEGRTIVSWRATDGAVQDEIKDYPQLAERFAALKEKRGVYFVEILDASTGRVLGAQLLDTGGRASILTMGERMIVSQKAYVEIYSMATGQKEGEIPGRPSAHCQTTNLVSVRSENENELEVYDLNTREKVDGFTFASDVRFDQFSKDGKRLLVLTEDQTAYFLDISKPAPPSCTP